MRSPEPPTILALLIGLGASLWLLATLPTEFGVPLATGATAVTLILAALVESTRPPKN